MGPIPRTIKKIGVRLLLWLFKGLVVLKRALKVFLFLVKEPFFAVYRVILKPVATWGYLVYRRIKRLVMRIVEPARERAMAVLANRYSVHVVVTAVVVAVMVSNLYARDSLAIQQLDQQHSILSDIALGDENIVVIEDQMTITKDTTYLSSQAVSAEQSGFSDSDSQSENGVDDGLYVEDSSEIALVSPFGTSVHVDMRPEVEHDRPTRTVIEEYIVQPGESIGSISRKFGLRTATLLDANGLTARSYIQPGQKLRVLPYDGIVYKVKSGDTVAKIGKTYDSDIQKILEVNNLADASGLVVGREIILPDGHLPAPPAPKRPAQIATNLRNVIAPPPSPNRASRGMIWPTAVRRVSQYWKGRRHTGVDIAGPVGTPIYAADDGVVVVAGWNSGGYGNMLLLDHGGGIYTRYGHSSKNLVQVGDTVKKGDTIALMGSTGRSTGPHLHFEVMTGSPRNRVNPLDYVR